ncbi:hypothetical protein Bpla01_56480 [Burkholderia plantarii]|nr:hypothetical protein Bpla01_56480 [Burkholderia plantarii]
MGIVLLPPVRCRNRTIGRKARRARPAAIPERLAGALDQDTCAVFEQARRSGAPPERHARDAKEPDAPLRVAPGS